MTSNSGVVGDALSPEHCHLYFSAFSLRVFPIITQNTLCWLLKKFALPERSPNAFSSRRNVVLDFGLGFGVSLLLLTVIILKNPFNNSFLNPMSWSFSFSNTGVSSSTSSSDLQNSTDFLQRNEEGMSQAKIHDENRHNESENASFPTKEEISKKPHEEKKDANESFITKSEPLMENTHNGTERVTETPKIKEENTTDNGGNVISPGREERVSEKTHENHLSGKGKIEGFYNDSGSVKRLADSSGKCDIFDGRWVRDARKPLYHPGSCPYIDRPGRCHLNGRPDDDFLKWKWQPNGCDMPSLKVTDFLERLRGKRLVFVGDSLNRNMWESLVCILRNGVKNKKRVYDVSGSKGFYSFRFMDYNCFIDFVPSPFLVSISSSKGQNGLIETLRLDLMDPKSSIYRKADILVFNTGHWWTHEKPSRGEDYYQEGNHVYPKLEFLEAYKKALTTWARWVDKNIDSKRTRVFFRGYSLTHYSSRGSQWSSGGHCYKETEPIFNETYVGRYPSTMKVAENVLKKMKTPVLYLNITRLTDYRKDGHPSIYIKEHKSIEEKIAAQKSQDCSHWCLPGVPDTWNELLYASLLIA